MGTAGLCADFRSPFSPFGVRIAIGWRPAAHAASSRERPTMICRKMAAPAPVRGSRRSASAGPASSFAIRSAMCGICLPRLGGGAPSPNSMSAPCPLCADALRSPRSNTASRRSKKTLSGRRSSPEYAHVEWTLARWRKPTRHGTDSSASPRSVCPASTNPRMYREGRSTGIRHSASGSDPEGL